MQQLIISIQKLLFLSPLISIGVALDNGIPMRRSDDHFCYEDDACGPDSKLWDGECKTGFRQSPINLPILSDASAKVARLQFNEKYYSDGK